MIHVIYGVPADVLRKGQGQGNVQYEQGQGIGIRGWDVVGTEVGKKGNGVVDNRMERWDSTELYLGPPSVLSINPPLNMHSDN